MTNLLLYNYYYRYAEARKQIKQLLQNNDIPNSDIKLNQYLAENDIYIQNVTAQFAVDDNLKLKHAKDHMNVVTEPNQKQAAQDAL